MVMARIQWKVLAEEFCNVLVVLRWKDLILRDIGIARPVIHP